MLLAWLKKLLLLWAAFCADSSWVKVPRTSDLVLSPKWNNDVNHLFSRPKEHCRRVGKIENGPESCEMLLTQSNFSYLLIIYTKSSQSKFLC